MIIDMFIEKYLLKIVMEVKFHPQLKFNKNILTK